MPLPPHQLCNVTVDVAPHVGEAMQKRKTPATGAVGAHALGTLGGSAAGPRRAARRHGSSLVDLHDFFFSSRRRHTRWPRDWSSDVCSSDLLLANGVSAHATWRHPRRAASRFHRARFPWPPGYKKLSDQPLLTPAPVFSKRLRVGQIGRASCRERGEGTGAAVCVPGTSSVVV